MKAGYLRWDLAIERVGREVEGNEAGEREQRGRQWAFEETSWEGELGDSAELAGDTDPAAVWSFLVPLVKNMWVFK